MSMSTYYAVYRGKQPGIYSTWRETREQTDGYPDAVFCRCSSLQEAKNFVERGSIGTTESPHSALPPPPLQVKKGFDIKRINKDDILTCRPRGARPAIAIPTDITGITKKYTTHPDYSHIPPGHLYVYTDGSTYGNGTRHARGGYSIFYSSSDLPPVYGPIKQDKVTNCVAELTAILETLRSVVSLKYEQVHIYSDCEYAMDVITGKKNAYVNLNLVEPAIALFKELSGRVKFIHVRSHTGAGDLHSVGNEIADILAKRGING